MILMGRYIRETKGDRHICSKCGAKRSAKFMKETGEITRYAYPEWICNDQFCGSAWENQHFAGKTSRVVQQGHTRLREEKQ